MDKTDLEKKVINILEKLPKEEAINYQRCRMYKRAGHMLTTALTSLSGYTFGFFYNSLVNYDKLIEIEQKNYPLIERVQEGFKFILSAQPEALAFGAIVGLVAYQISKRCPINYDKKLIKKFSNSEQ